MASDTYVRDSAGNVTHIREVSDDGRTSRLYEHDGSFIGEVLHSGKGDLVEVADHHPDGTTTAYEADTTFIGTVFSGSRGDEK